MTRGLVGARIQVLLPVTLSKDACRNVLVRTGSRPEPDQALHIEDLTDLALPERERVVYIWERIEVAAAEDDLQGVTAYEWLRRGADGWSVWDNHGDHIPINEVFFPSPGSTLRLTEWLSGQLDEPAELLAMLQGAPYVAELTEPELSLDVVLDAYDRALVLSERITELAREGERGDDEWWHEGISEGDDFAVLRSTEDLDLPAVGFLRRSDPEAFDRLKALISEIQSTSRKLQSRFTDVVVKNARTHEASGEAMSDGGFIEGVVQPTAEVILKEHATDQAKLVWQGNYERERARWIQSNGSRRLKLAAERGYRHDGLYRDERLAQDLPGFVALTKDDQIKEILNPTEEALELESEVLQHVAERDLGKLDIKLVWVTTSFASGNSDGEYVQARGFLGRHNVYRPVAEPSSDDDIPF